MLPFIIKEKDPLSNLFRAILLKDIAEKYWKLCDRELIQKRKNWLSWRAQFNVLIKQKFVIGYYIKVNASLTSEMFTDPFTDPFAGVLSRDDP